MNELELHIYISLNLSLAHSPFIVLTLGLQGKNRWKFILSHAWATSTANAIAGSNHVHSNKRNKFVDRGNLAGDEYLLRSMESRYVGAEVMTMVRRYLNSSKSTLKLNLLPNK